MKILFAIIPVVMVFTFSCSSEGSCDASQEGNTEHSTMTYDGKIYKTVRICAQTWMAENLNYAAEGSKCYGNEPEYCETYGRLYDFATAKTVCPSGWHLPSDAEWNELMIATGGSSKTAGEHLKNKKGWSMCDPEGMYFNWCLDTYGFSALPGGYGAYNYFYGRGDEGYWWSASKDIGDYNRYIRISATANSVGNDPDINENGLFSVRCLRN